LLPTARHSWQRPKPALDRTGRKSKMLQSMAIEQAVAKSVALEILDDDLVGRARRMATVYTAIAAFENSVRDFVSRRLLEHAGENWWVQCVSEKIRTKAESRREEEAKIWQVSAGAPDTSVDGNIRLP